MDKKDEEYINFVNNVSDDYGRGNTCFILNKVLTLNKKRLW